MPSTVVAYKTSAEELADDVLKLRNGAVVQITSGHLSYTGYGRDVVLVRVGETWRVWVERKRAFRCDVLKMPTIGTPLPAREVTIVTIAGNGQIFKTLEGEVFGTEDGLNSTLWLTPFSGLLLTESELINYDDASGAVAVRRLR